MATLERIPFATQMKIFKRLADIADSRCLSKLRLPLPRTFLP